MSTPAARGAHTIYTIGHSNHALPVFLDLLCGHGIEVLVDVRSQPYSRYATHFAVPPLKAAVIEAGLKYLFLGRELGGRPEGASYYDEDGRVDYAAVARSPLFRAGIDRLKTGSAGYRVAILCSEENPTGCHRRRLVGRVLAGEGVQVLHIRGDGTLTTEEELAAVERPAPAGDQLMLFDLQPEQEAWKSLLPVRGPRGA
ncbi:MAG TPA: DUF488 domain-containing protein [Chloroflexota bacterium]|jgi:uncharacterized protein (DUF488 family)|nr:DUF488 domain-containing protein [Chloroflexota bacterium]